MESHTPFLGTHGLIKNSNDIRDLQNPTGKDNRTAGTGKTSQETISNQTQAKCGLKTTSETATVYEIAKNGGRHHGTYTNYLNRSTKELKKSIKTYTKRIIEHQNLIKDPAKYLKAYGKEIKVPWDTLKLKERQNLLNNHWPKEIKMPVL